jgi:hypothetical protein
MRTRAKEISGRVASRKALEERESLLLLDGNGHVLEHRPRNSPAAGVLHECGDAIELVGDIRFGIRNPKDLRGKAIDITVNVRVHHGQANCKVLAGFQRTRLIHALSMERQLPEAHVGGREYLDEAASLEPIVPLDVHR